MNQDSKFMHRALELASKGGVAVLPNPRVGAVLVKNNKIVGEGWHKKFGAAHAEVMAIKQAGAKSKGATLYCSLEPCSHQGKQPPCTSTILQAGIKTVCVAQQDPNPKVSGLAFLKKNSVKVKSGLLKKEALKLNPGFNFAIKHKRPYLHAKIATSKDGYMASADRKSIWLTNTASRKEGHLIRARHQAIITGIETILIDDPQLTVRYGAKCYPARVVLDSSLRIPLTAALLKKSKAPVHIFTAKKVSKQKVYKLIKMGVSVHAVNCTEDGHLSLSAVLKECYRLGWIELMLEAGPKLTSAFIKKSYVNEISWFKSSQNLGKGVALSRLAVKNLNESFVLKQDKSKNLKNDVLYNGILKPKSL